MLYITWECSFMKPVLSCKFDVAIVAYFWCRLVVAKSDNVLHAMSSICYQNDQKTDVVIVIFFLTLYQRHCVYWEYASFANQTIIWVLMRQFCYVQANIFSFKMLSWNKITRTSHLFTIVIKWHISVSAEGMTWHCCGVSLLNAFPC